jgi:hypothetical protein
MGVEGGRHHIRGRGAEADEAVRSYEDRAALWRAGLGGRRNNWPRHARLQKGRANPVQSRRRPEHDEMMAFAPEYKRGGENGLREGADRSSPEYLRFLGSACGGL